MTKHMIFKGLKEIIVEMAKEEGEHIYYHDLIKKMEDFEKDIYA